MGTQDWNVEFDKNFEKNLGHDESVKLLPMDVSKGEGRGVVTTVTVGDIEVDTASGWLDGADVSVLIALAAVATASVTMTAASVSGCVEVGLIAVVGTVLSLSPTCRSCSKCICRDCGGSRVSMWISPFSASS